MARAVPVAQQARLLAGLAVTGAVPLTAGAILWVTGTVMGAAYHGGWGGTAGLGEVLVLAGLFCGGVMFAVPAAAGRWAVPGSGASRGAAGQAGTGEPALLPLDSPEQQAFLADPRPPGSSP